MEITEKQLDGVVGQMLPAGYTRFRRNRGSPVPRLVKGIELVNIRNEWAISLYRNVNNVDNDVEIAIGVSRIVDEGVPHGAVLKWLEALRGTFRHGEHAPHHSSYKGEVFRIGLGLEDAREFLGLVMAEVLKRPSDSPWDASGFLPGSIPAVAIAEVQTLTGRSSAGGRASEIARMVQMALQARDQSGQVRTSITKDKEVRFASAREFEAHLETLWQSDCCALSNLKLDLTGADPELAPSLDRIDSSKHYEPGNLQVVARFINRWKSDDDVNNFVRLLELVRAPGRQTE